MRILVGADERTEMTDELGRHLAELGHEVVDTLGPAAGREHRWADLAIEIARRIASGEADQGIVCCWTGTGVSIAANKIPGIRAALCSDAEQARGARLYNDANILALSLRTTTPALMKEILEAWFATPQPDPAELDQIAKLEAQSSNEG
ncbi:MAG: RpiB/LacA/LacB family sugar-phosphate isomerase [Actinomycetota bacterium]